MKKFICLHFSKNKYTYVNVDMVITIKPDEDPKTGSYLFFRDSLGRKVPGFHVLESAPEIISMIEN